MNEEEMRAEIVRLNEVLNTTNALNETLTTGGLADKTRIQELQEHNQKLFLKVTSVPEKRADEVQELSMDDFIKSINI